MIRFLIKSGSKSIYLVLLGLCFCLLIWQRSQQEVDTSYEERSVAFFQENEAVTYEEIGEMIDGIAEKTHGIREFKGYEGELTEDPWAEHFMTIYPFVVTLDMVDWQEEQWNEKGQWMETVRLDMSFLVELRQAMSLQMNWQEFADNRLELLSRNIRRYRQDPFRCVAFQDMTARYQVIYQDLEETCSDQKDYVYPDGVGKYLTQLREDFGHLLILLLVSFPVFVTFLKEGIGAQGLISHMGIRASIRKQYISHMVWSFLLYWGYMLLLLLPWYEQVFQKEWLEKPVQIVAGYEYFPYSITIAGFILLLMALKCIMAMAIVSLILGLSFVSKNNIVSMVAGGLLVVGMMAAGVLAWPVEAFNGLPYFPLFTYPIPKIAVLVLVCILLVILMGLLLPAFGKRRMLKIYSGR